MRTSGANRAVSVVVAALAAAALAACGGGSSSGAVADAPQGPGLGAGNGGVRTTSLDITHSPSYSPADATPAAGAATGDSPTAGPVQSGIVDPNDPQGVAAGYGVTLVDPQAAGMVKYGIVGFRSPSGRILCAVEDESGGTPANARCDVYENTWKPPARPSDCDLDWGSSVGVTAGRRAGFLCVGDVAFDGGGTLGYGKAVLVGPVLCMSRQTGVECVVTSGAKHGFKVSKAAYSVY